MENKITITLTVQEAELIMKAIIKLPFEQVASLVSSFDTQVRSQIDRTPQ